MTTTRHWVIGALLLSSVGLFAPPSSAQQVNVGISGTGAVRFTDASALVCDATTEGSIRYEDASNRVEFCDDTVWTVLGPGGGGSTTLNSILAATADQAGIANAGYSVVWNWDSLAGATALRLASSSTAAASNAQTILAVALSGANATSTQTTYAATFANTHTGTSSTNVGLSASASGGTNNYAAIFPTGNVGIGDSTPEVPLRLQSGIASTAMYASTASIAADDPDRGWFKIYFDSNTNAFVDLAGQFNYGTPAVRLDPTTFGTGSYFLSNLGAGTTTPAAALHAAESSTTGNTTLEVLRLQRVDSDSAAANNVGAAMTFWNETATDGTNRETGRISGVFTTATDASKVGELKFYATSGSGAGTSLEVANMQSTRKLVVVPPATETIAGGGTITANACGTIKRLDAGSSVTTNTSNTFTGSTSAGCCMDVINVDAADTITLDANGAFKTIGGADQALDPLDTVRVCSDGTNWYQMGAVSGNS